MIKQEGLYQNKVNSNLGSIHNCKMAYYNKAFGGKSHLVLVVVLVLESKGL